MALKVEPPPLGMQAPTPALVKPVDLQPALDRLHNAYREGFINAQDIQKRSIIGTSDAEAQAAQNQAAKAKAQQDKLDQTGGFSRLPSVTPQAQAAQFQATSDAALAQNQPSMLTSAGSSAFLDAASADDFNPAHESTDALLRLLREGGYALP